MNRLSLTIAICFAAAIAVHTQATRPSPTPTPDDDVVKISTSLIQVDVTVTDNKGNIITDLKPSEVEIYENGEKQSITNFSFVSNVKAAAPAADKNKDKNGIPIPQGTLRPEQIHRTIALVVDDLSLSFRSAYDTRNALKKFVDEQMQPGDLVAIIRTGAGIGALQQFTSDKRILYAAIEKVKWNPQGSGGVTAFAPIDATPEADSTDTSDSDPADDTSAPSGMGQSLDDFRGTLFATGTLGALKYIVTGMSELPGRKSVIMFSDGFKLFETDELGMQQSGQVLDFLRQLVDLANRSSVVFYTVDARGLAATGFTAADNISDTSPDAMQAASQARSDQLLDTQEGLSYLADETGGFVVKNNNDLSGGVQRVLNDQSYYLVGYAPDTDTFDAAKRKFNTLVVKVLRKGTKVRYRSGFFGVEQKPDTAPAAMEPVARLETALVSPFAVEGIHMRLNALFGNDLKTGSFVRSLLHIDANDLKFTDEKDGTKKAIFDVLAMSFGDNGQIVDRIGQTHTITLKPAAYKKIIADGFVYQFAFPVKKPGAYQYRVAIRDTRAGHVGSASQFIEVPDLGKKRLTLSSLVLEDLTAEQWRSLSGAAGARLSTNPLADTALRRVKAASVLRYGFEIYNAGLDPAKQPALETKIRVFRDSQLVLDGKQTPFELLGQTDLKHLKAAGALAIGEKMVPGDYILQVIVTDRTGGSKAKIATQFVQFEVVD